VRVSGPEAQRIASTLLERTTPLQPRHATVATFRAASEGTHAPLSDHVVATWFPAPNSYTTQDVVEISAHGSPLILRAVIESALAAGARLARPGEFTLRAYLGGRFDLTQAEAVADLIASATPLQARAASEQLDGRLAKAIHEVDVPLFDLIARLEASLDFPEEGYHFVAADEVATTIATLRATLGRLLASGRRGRVVREGITVAIVGRPNTGKSTLFNRLVGSDRAIVTATPGTTRDVLTETVDLGGLRATVVDTAGVRTTSDEIEAEGVRRAAAAAAAATVTVVVLDLSAQLDPEDLTLLEASTQTRVVTANKRDCPAVWDPTTVGVDAIISARTGDGIEALVDAIHAAAGATAASEEIPLVTNIRHLTLIGRAEAALGRAEAALRRDPPIAEEFVLADLHDTRQTLEEVVGARTPDDVLEHIFSRFCIGK
jgi:tRNA modification GTPase